MKKFIKQKLEEYEDSDIDLHALSAILVKYVDSIDLKPEEKLSFAADIHGSSANFGGNHLPRTSSQKSVKSSLSRPASWRFVNETSDADSVVSSKAPINDMNQSAFTLNKTESLFSLNSGVATQNVVNSKAKRPDAMEVEHLYSKLGFRDGPSSKGSTMPRTASQRMNFSPILGKLGETENSVISYR